jgi:hypothetical protein
MASNEIRVPIADVMKRVTMQITVTGTTRWRIRLWLAGWILKLAARVAGCGLEVHSQRHPNNSNPNNPNQETP